MEGCVGALVGEMSEERKALVRKVGKEGQRKWRGRQRGRERRREREEGGRKGVRRGKGRRGSNYLKVDYIQTFLSQVFQKLDSQKRGTIRLGEMHRFFSASRHPAVVAGRESAEEAWSELFRCLQTGEDGGTISYAVSGSWSSIWEWEVTCFIYTYSLVTKGLVMGLLLLYS